MKKGRIKTLYKRVFQMKKGSDIFKGVIGEEDSSESGRNAWVCRVKNHPELKARHGHFGFFSSGNFESEDSNDSETYLDSIKHASKVDAASPKKNKEEKMKKMKEDSFLEERVLNSNLSNLGFSRDGNRISRFGFPRKVKEKNKEMTLLKTDYDGYDYETYIGFVSNPGCDRQYSIPAFKKEREKTKRLQEKLNRDEEGPIPTIAGGSVGIELLDVSKRIFIKFRSALPAGVPAFHDGGRVNYACSVSYEVASSSGSPMFYAAELSENNQPFFSCWWLGFPNHYAIQLVDPCGRPIMSIRPVKLRKFYKVLKYFNIMTGAEFREFEIIKSGGGIIASIYQTKKDHCRIGFTVKNGEGSKILKVCGGNCALWPGTGSMLSRLTPFVSCKSKSGSLFAVTDGKKILANISNGDDQGGRLPCHYTVDYTSNINAGTKLLILGISFVLDFLYWRDLQ